MKRLRRRLEPARIRFYAVSEYGEKNNRPHYHAIIFGHDFSRDEGARLVKRGLYSSPLLEAAWGLGHVSTGEVTDASIRYVCNYVLDKEDVPLYVSQETGESRPCAPVFALMSRNPGIGAAWIDAHSQETYRDDNVVNAGFRRQPPRYYDKRAFPDSPDPDSKYTGKKNLQNLGLLALRQARRSANLETLERDPANWLQNNDPLRRAAEAEIWKSKKALEPTGEL